MMQDVAEIRVGGELLSRVVSGPESAGVAGLLEEYRKIWMVYDANVATHAARIEDALRQSGKLAATLPLHVSEESKTIETVLSLEDWLLATGADRDALLLAVGGGITTDMAGFAASVYKRGIRFAFVPTTLLAQVDAAIGGKTGVNFHSLKNMLGIIRQPDFTYLCPDVLETLPARDFRSGAAEMLKTFIIEDGGNYEKAVRVLSDIAAGASIASRRNELQQLISAAAAVKAGVVSRDQFESGERRKLNLGHTFAHAIEWKARESGSDITHGEAVAIGIIQAAKLTDKALADRLQSDFSEAGLPTALPFPLATLADAMLKDKKAEGGKVHFVLIKSIGDVYTEDLTVAEAIAKL
ncbi:MAG: 3-dehydroquinate synthase [Bacteroidales bacterium]|nr:3-dehydroquinate synthase [Bacteroidales bacterium]